MMVSVIIPTYNRVHTLGRAVQSVLKQNVGADLVSALRVRTRRAPTFEIIIVDDGSSDGTKDLILPLSLPSPPKGERVRARGLRYIFQPNRGPSAARNLGILNSNLEFIAFLDSDDEWLSGKLAAQLRFFEENPESLVCQTEEIWIRNGRRVNPMKKHKKYGGWIFEKCLPLSIVSPSAIMARREFFDIVGLFDESLPACEDYDLWLRASARFPIGLIEKPYVVKYGGHADQRSRQFSVMDRFRIQALQKILGSGCLGPEQREATLREMKRKCEIVAQGARKRGKVEEAEYYERV